MVRELAISIYLFTFSLIFKLSSIVSLKRKVLFVVSFSENNINIYEEYQRQEHSCRAIFLTTKKMYPLFKKYKGADCTVLLFEPSSPIQYIKGIYHLATSKVIFVDNYYGFLSSIKFREGVTCIQLWHANGAIKKFGLMDPSIENRSEKAKERFVKVYNQFHKVVAGSDEMKTIFQKAFGVREENFMLTGIPRTDIFFNTEEIEGIKDKLLKKYPSFRQKKIILYAPTFRDDNLDDYEIRINFDLMKDKLGEEYLLLLKLHPAIKNKVAITENQADFVVDVSGYSNTNDLLFITDYLITDYSSIPFEFSLLEKPMIFFPYDLSKYVKKRGTWGDYEEIMPGPVVYSTNDIIHAIKSNNFNYAEIREFKEKWNKYSDGNASKRIADIISSII